ncbi:MAG: Succinyl-diaminopimelate desuccinylase [Syntrophaceae bacterium PtaB.Bin095]|nr:MAG: Succinyl-diaminopimelate desuccinylase [Syntrophaceae bacterium PtaB.Bin095]
MIDQAIFSTVRRRIDSYREAMIQMQIGLTAIPALAPENGGDGEYEKARYLLANLRELGFTDIWEINAPDSRVSSKVRPNIIASVPGRKDNRTVWILTHLDIVPPGEMKFWDSDPYRGYVKNDRIYGRGTEDNQQDLVASLFAAKAFLDEGIVPESNIGLAFVSDEETASRWGLDYILRHENNPFKNTDLLVVPDSGNEEGTMIEIAEKSIYWLRFKTVGKQCHASKPELGKNAFLAASHLVVRLDELHGSFGAVDALYHPPMSTFQPTKKEMNVPNVNTIPGEDVFYLDCRILPQYSLQEVHGRIRSMADDIERRFGVRIEIKAVQDVQAPAPTPEDAPVVPALQEAIRAVYRLQANPEGIGAGTVAAYFRRDGYPAAVWCRIGQTAHQPNENCLISNMMGNAKVYAHLFLQK